MLSEIEQELQNRERHYLSDRACLSEKSLRRNHEVLRGYRQNFAVDADRILHAKSYTRYIDKTQVFCMVKNDHITHRVLHVQFVSKIGRTIARFLGLNEDLIEAIALGHDIGHPPFGHDGEYILSDICKKYGLPSFLHNLQSVRFLEHIEKKGRGLNLSLQTLDGILCHDGEVESNQLIPDRQKDFEIFDKQYIDKENNPKLNQIPMTMEGCVVRLADTIAYIGRDIEDAIELNLISREDIPFNCTKTLGKTNGTIVYNLVTDLITTSKGQDFVGFSNVIATALKELKSFNYKRIYLNPALKPDKLLICQCYKAVFESYLKQIDQKNHSREILPEFNEHLQTPYISSTSPEIVVRDFIAGMTDDYFLTQASLLGCTIPEKK